MLSRSITWRCLAASVLLAALWLPLQASAQSRETFRAPQDSPRRDQSPRSPAADRRRAAAGAMNAFVQRLMEVAPARRREMLANNRRFQRLPTAQRRAIEARLQRFDRLPAEERELMVQRYQLFSRLNPARQSQARTAYREWSGLPRARRNRITQAVRRLRNSTPEGRLEILESERFAGLFDEEDRQIIERLLSLTPPVVTDRAPARDR
jgi:hypothetical protein